MKTIFTALLIAPFVFIISCNDAAPTKTPKSDQSGHVHKHDWGVKNLNATQAARLLRDKPKLGVIDVRTPEEFAQGHLKGAVNIDFKAADFAEKIAEVNNHRSYLIHCRSGGRSNKSLKTFKSSNFGTIYHLDGGMNAWQAAGLPVEK